MMMLSEARAKKAEADRIAFINDQKALAEKQSIAAWLKANPEVGTLTVDGETVYYRYPVNGAYVEVEALS